MQWSIRCLPSSEDWCHPRLISWSTVRLDARPHFRMLAGGSSRRGQGESNVFIISLTVWVQYHAIWPYKYSSHISTINRMQIEWINTRAMFDLPGWHHRHDATFDGNLQQLKAVFQWLRDAGLKLKPESHFAQPEVQYLGHIVSQSSLVKL